MEGYADCISHILYAAMEKLHSNPKWNVCFLDGKCKFLKENTVFRTKTTEKNS